MRAFGSRCPGSRGGGRGVGSGRFLLPSTYCTVFPITPFCALAPPPCCWNLFSRLRCECLATPTH